MNRVVGVRQSVRQSRYVLRERALLRFAFIHDAQQFILQILIDLLDPLVRLVQARILLLPDQQFLLHRGQFPIRELVGLVQKLRLHRYDVIVPLEQPLTQVFYLRMQMHVTVLLLAVLSASAALTAAFLRNCKLVDLLRIHSKCIALNFTITSLQLT